MSYGKIISVEEFSENGMEGYKVSTKHISVRVLIDSFQSCCESWGYISSDDDFTPFIGAILKEVKLTDVALNQQVVDDTGYYDEGGGIQFVDFVTSRGTFQLAVYNAHNGYYGHGILVALGEDILCNDTL